jgi:hypothetical protein
VKQEHSCNDIWDSDNLLVLAHMDTAVSIDMIWNIFTSAGFPGLVFLIAWGGFQGRWRWGREYDNMVAEKDRQITLITIDRDYWKNMAVDLLKINEQTAQVAGAVVRRKSAT